MPFRDAILLIDDDPDFQSILQRNLSEEAQLHVLSTGESMRQGQVNSLLTASSSEMGVILIDFDCKIQCM